MTTVKEIKKSVDAAYTPRSRRQIFRYLKRAGVKPIGRQSRPRFYPDDAAARVLKYLELPAVPTMPQLRDLKRRSAQARRAA